VKTWTIRRATESDVPAIVALLADDHLGATRESPGDLAPYASAFAAIDADPNVFLAVMEAENRLIGTMQLTFLHGLSFKGAVRLQIEAVRIASDLRGQGLGGELIAWGVAQARARGCRLVQLTSNAARPDAHRFYERLGFHHTHAGFKLDLAPPE
jgi:GNAT superfamily N-acetyltransferase